MKKSYLTFLCAMIAIVVTAQTPITLTQSNMPVLNPVLQHFHSADVTGIANPSIGSNETWDYSGLTGGVAGSNIDVRCPLFSSTAIKDTTGFENIIKTLRCASGYVYDRDANGFFYAGDSIGSQWFDLSSISGNVKDTVYVPSQTFKLRENLIPFPSTMGTVWTDHLRHALNLEVSIYHLGFSHKAFSKVVNTTIVDSVIGWGTLSVPSSNKASEPYPVLMIKKHFDTRDSFYVNNFPAPKVLLDSLHTIQNGRAIDYRLEFYRVGHYRPLLYIDYGNDYTMTKPASASYSSDVTSGIAENNPQETTNLVIYPNPANSGAVNLSFRKTSTLAWNIRICDDLGKTIAYQPVNGNGNINIRADVSEASNGLYFINIIDENGELVGKSKLDIQK